VRAAITECAKVTAESHDEAAANAIIKTARSFFTEIMDAQGCRSDIVMNAFYVATSALVPVTAVDDEMVRSVMRLLGLRHEIRTVMTDSAAGWKWTETKPHADRTDWNPLIKWLHSDEAPTPDNDRKAEIKVSVFDDGATLSYELHDRRFWNESHVVLQMVSFP